MSKQATTRSTVSFNAPRANSICGMTWDMFACAETPVTSKHLPEIAEKTGFNLTNLRIELSRYNRFVAAHGKFQR